MASILQIKNGFRAAVYVRGIRDTKQFRTKREAQAWASARETELRILPPADPGEKHTLLDAFEKYAEDICPTHKGEKWERVRLIKFSRELPASTKRIGEVTTTDLAEWRDQRLKTVAASSVLREIKLLGSVFEVARKEWRWVGLNPVRDLKKPRAPEHRKRTVSAWEILAMFRAMNYSPRGKIRTVAQAVAAAFYLALRTGMRAGELATLRWEHIHEKYCHLPSTKSMGTRTRDVPLSAKAKRVIEGVRGWDGETVFGLKSQTLDALFRRYRDRAGLSGFTFHDSRHTAATWMAKKVDVLTLCKIFGWSSTTMALVYYNPKAADIADLL